MPPFLMPPSSCLCRAANYTIRQIQFVPTFYWWVQESGPVPMDELLSKLTYRQGTSSHSDMSLILDLDGLQGG
jgi:hypothetical protein